MDKVKICQECWNYGSTRVKPKPKGRLVGSRLVIICKNSNDCQSIYHKQITGGK